MNLYCVLCHVGTVYHMRDMSEIRFCCKHGINELYQMLKMILR
jgi:hypothetical protein